MIFVKDLEGRYLRINRRLSELLQVSNEDIQGRTDRDFFSEEVVEIMRASDRSSHDRHFTDGEIAALFVFSCRMFPPG